MMINSKRLGIALLLVTMSACAKDDPLSFSMADAQKGLTGSYAPQSGVKIDFAAGPGVEGGVYGVTIDRDGVRVADMTVDAAGGAKVRAYGQETEQVMLELVGSKDAEYIRDLEAAVAAATAHDPGLAKWAELIGGLIAAMDTASNDDTFSIGDCTDQCGHCAICTHVNILIAEGCMGIWCRDQE